MSSFHAELSMSSLHLEIITEEPTVTLDNEIAYSCKNEQATDIVGDTVDYL